MVSRNSPESTLPTRVSVLEHGVSELKAGLDSHRGETRAAFNSLQMSLDRLGDDVSSRAQPTNWYGLLSAIAATVVIIGGIFALAEWRVTAALAPINEVRLERGVVLRDLQSQIFELRNKTTILDTASERIRIEENARITARVNAEFNRANAASSATK